MKSIIATAFAVVALASACSDSSTTGTTDNGPSCASVCESLKRCGPNNADCLTPCASYTAGKKQCLMNASCADLSTCTDSSSSSSGSVENDASADSPTGPSKTKAGESCEAADLPAASSSCAIAGTYDVTETLCSSTDATCTNIQTASPFTWTATVTVAGTAVKITNGTNRLSNCVLTPPCTCKTKSGDEYRFSATGFVTLAGSSCQGTATQPMRVVGVKR